MTYWQQTGSQDLGVGSGRARPLSRGLGLAIGVVVSLGLWAGLAYVAVRLFG